jgi:hypothetical protein
VECFLCRMVSMFISSKAPHRAPRSQERPVARQTGRPTLGSPAYRGSSTADRYSWQRLTRRIAQQRVPHPRSNVLPRSRRKITCMVSAATAAIMRLCFNCAGYRVDLPPAVWG